MPRGTIFVNQQCVAPVDSPPNNTLAATGEKESPVDPEGDSAVAKKMGVSTRLIREDREASQRLAHEKREMEMAEIHKALPNASLNVGHQAKRLAEYNKEQLVDSTTFTSGPTDKGPGGAVQLNPQQQHAVYHADDHAYNLPKPPPSSAQQAAYPHAASGGQHSDTYNPSPSSAIQQQQAAYLNAASDGQHRDAHNPPPPSSATDPRSGTPSDNNPYQLAVNSAVELLDTSPQQYGTIKWMGYLPRVRPLIAGVELVSCIYIIDCLDNLLICNTGRRHGRLH